MKNYKIESLNLSGGGGTLPSDCQDITFVNFGDNATPPVGAVLIIDDHIRITAGQQLVISSDDGSKNITKHRFKWDTSASGVKNGIVVKRIEQ